MTPYLARIDIYPVKSLDGLTVSSAAVLPSGALRGDRAFALFDAAGKFVNGKRHPRIHQVRSQFSEDLTSLRLWTTDATAASTFALTDNSPALAAWFSHYFEQPVTLCHNDEMGFPDDTASPGPTVISTATLRTVADWYGLDVDEARRRFRTNLEIDGVPAFWEDRLFSANGESVTFQIGAIIFQGINPCQRCIVPTRDSRTGASTENFQKRFSERRVATLPDEVARSRFNHFYRLAVNTRLHPDSPLNSLAVGDAVSLL